MQDLDYILDSRKLSLLDIRFSMDNLDVEVLWFRVMAIKDSNFTIPWHSHSSYEFHFVKQGSCVVNIQGREVTVREGEFYLTGRGVYHEQRCLSDPFVEFSLNCDLSLTDDEKTESSLVFELLNAERGEIKKDTAGIMKLFEAALLEVHNETVGYFSRIKCLVAMILTAAAAAFAGDLKATFEAPVKTSKINKTLSRALAYIAENSNRSISVAEVAKYCFISKRQLGRIMLDKTGQSTKKIIMEYRHKRAKQLLADTSLSSKEIGLMLGFNDPSNFAKTFKEIEGCTPEYYRKHYTLG